MDVLVVALLLVAAPDGQPRRLDDDDLASAELAVRVTHLAECLSSLEDRGRDDRASASPDVRVRSITESPRATPERAASLCQTRAPHDWQRLLTIPAGRRAKWLVFGVWLVAIMAIGGGRAAREVRRGAGERVHVVPARRRRVDRRRSRRASGSRATSSRRSSSSTSATAGSRPTTSTRIESDRDDAQRRPARADRRPTASRSQSPVGRRGDHPGGRPRRRRERHDPRPRRPGARARRRRGRARDVEVAGGAAISADAIEVFESIDGTLLLATLAIVFILLLAVYRSPIFWFFPLLAVIFAEVAVARARLRADRDRRHRQRPVGRDPAGARLRRRHRLRAAARRPLPRGAAPADDKHEAMAEALRRAGPAILASGLTVIAALLCLTLADVEGTAGLGPIGAMGIAVAMVAMLTALPALLVIAGRWAFWPFIPHVGDEAADETHGIWRRIGERIAAAPAAGLDRDRRLPARPLPRLAGDRPRADPGQPVPRRRRLGRRPGAARRVVPGGSRRADGGDRPDPAQRGGRQRRR